MGLKTGPSRAAVARWWPLSLLLVGCAVSMLQLHDNAITDPFHYGEYFSYFTSLRSGTFAGQAISLHGALEYAPAWLAHGLAGPDHDLFWTMVFLAAFGVLSALLFLLVVSTLLDDVPSKASILAAVALLAPLLMSSREVFLFASLWLAIRIVRKPPSGRVTGWVTEVALGITVAIGLFWSFDRGLAELIAIGAPALLLFVRGPAFRVAALAWIGCLAVLGSATRVFSWTGYVDNLRFIVDVSGQFAYGWTRESILLKAGGLAITVAAMVLMWRVARRDRDAPGRFIALMLALLCAVVLRVVSYRADIWHYPAMLWAPILALVFAHARLSAAADRRFLAATLFSTGVVVALLAVEFAWYGRVIFVATFVLLVALLRPRAERLVTARRWVVHAGTAVLAIVVLARFGIAAFRDGSFEWVARTVATPTNASLVPREINGIADALAAHRVRCVMDMSNRGLINGVLDLPACTRFTYPVYATAKYEDEMIASLEASGVPAVVYSATTWSYRIDGLAMPMRFPKLDAFLQTRYPVLACTAEYCIRSMKVAD